jgi:UPF0716 family protein affecting phage T7 exclusion
MIEVQVDAGPLAEHTPGQVADRRHARMPDRGDDPGRLLLDRTTEVGVHARDQPIEVDEETEEVTVLKEWEDTPEDFGRIAAQTAKQVILGRLRDAEREITFGEYAGREVVHGVMILLAGILLMIPGFLTDTVGLLLFIPPIRDLGWSFIRSRFAFVAGADFHRARWGGRQDGRTIDLEEDQYSRDRKPDTPLRLPNSD